MGYSQAADMAEMVQEGQTSLHQALLYHLRCNHYPPAPESMVDVALQAIRAGSQDDWTKRIQLPEGVTHRRYGRMAPAFAIVEAFHLEPFIQEDSDD
jgi:hypothetical protein